MQLAKAGVEFTVMGGCVFRNPSRWTSVARHVGCRALGRCKEKPAADGRLLACPTTDPWRDATDGQLFIHVFLFFFFFVFLPLLAFFQVHSGEACTLIAQTRRITITTDGLEHVRSSLNPFLIFVF
jgi:hypothetical protein